MAERSFVREVQKLRLGEGEEFSGEGILAITKALLQCGVGYVGGYQGAPISHLMDVLADAQEILGELGVHFEASASEATATAMLAASVHYPIRGAATFKSTVGTNVASDALANLASGGVTGGALIIVGEDYGEGSSIMQERSHAFAMKSQVWLLDPRPNLPSIVSAVEHGFELSEASNTPVMLQVRIRSCHVHGTFIAKNNRRPSMTVAEALENPRRDTGRIVLPPASFMHEREKVEKRLPAAIEYIRKNRLNEVFGGQGPVGIIMQGGMYNGIVRALQRLGLADVYGRTEVPLYVLNVTYPLVEDELLEFCAGKEAVLVVEEGQPHYIEQALGSMLYKAGASVRLEGKGILPMAGEYTGDVMLSGVGNFLRQYADEMLPPEIRAPNMPARPVDQDLAKTVPMRPPGFCVGCPERPIFAATKLVEQELGKHHIASDIGCHLFSIMPPFELGATTMGYGLGPASASAFNSPDAKRRSISFVGDGGFWHNGLTSSIGNAVFNKNDGVIVVVDNYYAAATGGQDILSSRAENPTKATKHPITEALKGMGVKWVRHLERTYDVGKMRDTLKEALTTNETGPKVIVASSECMLNRQRRERPLLRKAVAEGKRVVRTKFGVDEDVCTGDHACMRLSGCPSLTVKHLDDPLRDDPVAFIDQNCVGCGNCGEVADAAVLCPSFYQADVVNNPTRWERFRANVSRRVIGWLQARRESRRLIFAEAAP
ncbi:indolepyruvate ferredoxin oxidoreductase subunit alpha [Chelativorans sp. Marseille-P2723]|uniref:thiamine pyrophosphate-dependent enzyme n=1 Tax=Chelativorans sp. Marseille-P2723 TaxID=2709133 RepID=UPI0015706C2E|nr:indolepyruvate ferredoxin oxidoreductase subunit alpha [Chelativorans sp. Marseille-P2723]